MTSSEMIEKLNQAQRLLADVYHWADSPLDGSVFKTNAEIASLMSAADDCIWDTINILED
jgi:hypothetical protein